MAPKKVILSGQRCSKGGGGGGGGGGGEALFASGKFFQPNNGTQPLFREMCLFSEIKQSNSK